MTYLFSQDDHPDAASNRQNYHDIAGLNTQSVPGCINHLKSENQICNRNGLQAALKFKNAFTFSGVENLREDEHTARYTQEPALAMTATCKLEENYQELNDEQCGYIHRHGQGIAVNYPPFSLYFLYKKFVYFFPAKTS